MSCVHHCQPSHHHPRSLLTKDHPRLLIPHRCCHSPQIVSGLSFALRGSSFVFRHLPWAGYPQCWGVKNVCPLEARPRQEGSETMRTRQIPGGKQSLQEWRTAPSSQEFRSGVGTVSSRVFSLFPFPLQSPRASCLLFHQACSHCGPQWALFHLSHLPQAQEKPPPLHLPAQVSLLHTKAAGGGRVRSIDLESDVCSVLCQLFLGLAEQPPPQLLAPVPLPQHLALYLAQRPALPLASPSLLLGWVCLCLHLLVSWPLSGMLG